MAVVFSETERRLQSLEDFARFLMRDMPPEEQRDFANAASFRLMRITKAPSSQSGSTYRVVNPQDAETWPPPPKDRKP